MFSRFYQFIASFYDDERGQGMVEYGLIIALVAIVVIGALTALGGGIEETFESISDALSGENGD